MRAAAVSGSKSGQRSINWMKIFSMFRAVAFAIGLASAPFAAHAQSNDVLQAGQRFVELLAKEGSDVKEFFSGNIIEFAFGQFALDRGLTGDELSEVLLMSGQEFFVKGFEFNGAQGVNCEAELAVPFHQGRLGNVEVFSDASQAPALGAVTDEFGFSICGVHRLGMGCREVGMLE